MLQIHSPHAFPVPSPNSSILGAFGAAVGGGGGEEVVLLWQKSLLSAEINQWIQARGFLPFFLKWLEMSPCSPAGLKVTLFTQAYTLLNNFLICFILFPLGQGQNEGKKPFWIPALPNI